MRSRITVFMLALGSASALAADLPPSPSTCASGIHPRSWELVTRAQAMNALRPEGDLNEGALVLAERALEVDPANSGAWSQLARLYLVAEDADRVDEAWRRAFAAGRPVMWTGTLYDVDARTYFVLGFDRASLRIWRFDQLAAPVRRGFYGIPELPAVYHPTFWAAMAGCLDGAPEAAVTIPWPEVREIIARNWVLEFKLSRPVTLTSDRTGKAKTLDRIKVALHGRMGELEVYKPVGEEHLAMRGRGPWTFQDRTRRTLVKFVDPDKRIALPPSKPGAGW